MKFTILIPHWRTGKMTAYAIYKLLENQGKHDVKIIVIDNNAGDGSAEYLKPFADKIQFVEYPKDKLQSHGIAFDYVMDKVETDFFITTESDSFPENDKWLDIYEKLAEKNIDTAGSILQLSGGTYLHPCGAMYKKENWEQAQQYIISEYSKYKYFESMAMKEGFGCHLMVHVDIISAFMADPERFIVLSDSYKPYSEIKAVRKLNHYSATVNPFHNGMGRYVESIKTYGYRSTDNAEDVILTGEPKIIHRIGYEPGQWFSYWHFAKNKKVFRMGTETKWINDMVGTQQEYTLMQNGFRHLWGVSAWSDQDPEHMFAKVKQPIPDRLYELLPDEYKIKNPAV